MSADNGIYIASFPNGEYRVAECAAIDNVDYGTVEMQDAYRMCNFGNAKVFKDVMEAYLYSLEIATALEKEGFYTEYGIRHLKFDRNLPSISMEEAYDRIS